MLKLYKNINGQLHYWETWNADEKTGTVHWGVVGDNGQTRDVKSGLFSNFRKEIQKEIYQKASEGYTPFDDMEQFTLLIEYKVDGMGTLEEMEKRHRLENKMSGTLGWTGLGHCDGGSIGSGTMEVCCLVVDFDIAKKVIAEELINTEFANYSRIFDENNP